MGTRGNWYQIDQTNPNSLGVYIPDPVSAGSPYRVSLLEGAVAEDLEALQRALTSRPHSDYVNDPASWFSRGRAEQQLLLHQLRESETPVDPASWQTAFRQYADSYDACSTIGTSPFSLRGVSPVPMVATILGERNRFVAAFHGDSAAAAYALGATVAVDNLLMQRARFNPQSLGARSFARTLFNGNGIDGTESSRRLSTRLSEIATILGIGDAVPDAEPDIETDRGTADAPLQRTVRSLHRRFDVKYGHSSN
jgi:hypothetical protein